MKFDKKDGEKTIQKQLASLIWMMRFDKKDEKKTHPKTVGLLDLDDEVWQKGGDHLPPKTTTVGILDLDDEF